MIDSRLLVAIVDIRTFFFNVLQMISILHHPKRPATSRWVSSLPPSLPQNVRGNDCSSVMVIKVFVISTASEVQLSSISMQIMPSLHQVP